MDAFERLPEELDHLIESFKSAPVVGDLTAGVTQYLFYMLLACALLLVVLFVFKRRQAASPVPHGAFVNGVEFGIEYVRDDILKGTMGDGWRRHFPFLATVFFFVLFNDLMGVIPGAHPGTGAIGVTAAVALMSFVYFIYIGCRSKGVVGYVKSLAPAGVAFPINLLVWIIEVFSTFLRLVTLAVRLFCNMYAGHIVMGAFAILASLFFEPLLEGVSAAAMGGAVVSVAWVGILIVIYAVEMLVAVIQAYIFTMLSAVYVNLAEEEE